jgi:predicted nucleic acid-binding protein
VPDPVPEEPVIVVLADANLLINLIHTGRLLILGQLPGHRFAVPDAVVAEVVFEDQRAQLTQAIATGAVSLYTLTDLDSLAQFADLRRTMGAGEAACLVLSQANGWSIASDEKKAFRREVYARIGKERLLTTASIYVQAINAGLLTVAEADVDKALLATKRFVMRFGSFAELLNVDRS